MRYEDTSGSVSGSATPEARDDADTLATGSNGPATGNVITGAGTTTGKAGADAPANGHVVAVRGASGTDSSDSGNSLHVDGRFGTLAIDEHGNYKYVADGHAPQNFRDLFQYTLADAKGGRSVADLVISRGGEIQVSQNAQKIVPNPDGTVTLPAGVDLNDVHVVGRDLVVTMPDGSQIVIVDGAVFVPQLVLGGVEVPSTNLAALLIDAEPKPAAGNPQSSGGNFEVPVGPLDPGVPLGDLIPPTELHFTPPEFQPVYPGQIDHQPTIEIQPDGQPAAVNAEDSVDEKGLPARNGGEPAGSGEIADGNGSNNSDVSETTAGTIIISSEDGVAGVSINGVAVTGAVGQVIHGAFGDMTITGFNGQNILYSYTLADNTSGNNTHDDFSVTITDPDGDQATATLVIDIIDDVPTARPDTDAIAAGQYGPETGNVLTGAGTTSGAAGADTVGADNAHISGVTGFNGSSDTDASGGFVVNGQYGVLTLQSDGSYSYTRNPGTPGGVNDVFNYTLTDGDGDTSTTTLTISIGDVPPTLNVPTGEDAGTLVYEAGLPTRNGGEPAGSGEIADGNGSNNSDPSERTDGTITFTPGDGPATVTINGTAVTAAGQTIAGSFGTLTIDSYDANGTITYHYVLGDNTSGNSTHDDFNVVVTDQDGDHSNGTLTINIVDDVPTAHNDTDALAAGSYGPETGNVISGAGTTSGAAGADVVGADNAQVSAVTGFNGSADSTVDGSGNLVVNGQYGVLTINQDGSYSYVRNAGTPGGVSDVFNYTLTDGDGDQSNATLTISIGDSPTDLNIPTGEDAGTLVHEAGLPTRNGGEPAGSGEIADGNGSNNSDPSERTDGTITFNPGDGPATVTINGTAVTGAGQTISGAFGTLTIDSYDANGTINYHYVLADNTSGDSTHDDFAVVVTDQDGDHSNGTLTINIVDDVPTAHNDTDSLAGGSFGPETGNVISGVGTTSGAAGADVVGADNAQVSSIASVNVPANSDGTADGSGNFVVTGQYGVLTINEDGSYSYTRNPGTPGGVSDVFNYQLTDGDGDHSNATLTINIGDATPHTDPNPAVGLDDDALAGGNPGGVGDDPNSVNVTGQLSGSGGDGALTFAVQTTGAPSGFTYVSGGAGIVLVQQGGTTVLTVTVGSDGSYSVVQNAPIDHAAGGDENNAGFTINYTVTDSDGDSAPGTLNISVDDDTPLAFNDTDVTDPATDTAVGNVISGVGTVEGAANHDAPGADGFGSITNLVGFNGSSDSNPSGGFSVNGQYGTLQMDADGNYTYTRNPGTPGGAVDTFTYTYVDGDGDPVSATLTVTISDHVPVAGNVNVGLDDDALAGGNPGGVGDDPDSVNATGNLPGSGGDAPLTFGVLLTGAPAGFSYVSGGAGVVLVQQGGTTVLTVTVGSDGSYSVVQNAPINHAAGGDENNQAITINYTVTDSDGDTAPGTISISVDDDTPTVSANAGIQLDDDALSGGNAGGVGDDPNSVNATGTLAHSYGADGAGSIVYLNSGAPAGFSYALQGNGDLWVMQGATHVLTLTVNSTTGAYSVTQVAAIDHPAGLDENNVSFTISYQVTDHDGDSATGSIVVNVDDDTPTVSANAAVQLDDDALTGGNPGGVGDDPNSVNATGTLAHSYGADGAGSIAYLNTGAPAGFSYALQGNGDLWVMQGATHVLTLTVNASTGAYTVTQVAPIDHATGLDENNVSFTISYNVTDHDGDSVTGSITVNVDDDTPTVALSGTSPSLTVDETVLTTDDTKSFAGMFTDSFGADGPAAANSVAYTLGINAGVTGLVDVATGQAIVLVNNAGVIEGHVGSAAGATAFTVTVDASGNVTLDQQRALSHPDATNPNDSVTLANDNLITLTQTITDHDGDQASATANIGQNLNFLDDGPTAHINTTGAGVSLDESVGIQADSNDTTSAGVIALFSGVANKGVDTDLPQYATNANAVVNSTGTTFGADGGTVSFSLNVSSAGVDSGLNTTDGHDILLYKEGNLIVGRVSGGTDDGKAAFAIAIDNTGHVSTVEYLSIQHPNAANPDDSVSIANGAVLAVVTATDGDNDTSSASVAIGGTISFQDSAPVLTAVDNINIQNSGDVAATGGFHYLLGADGASADNNVFSAVTGSATVNGNAVTNYTISETSENATSAVYNFSFDYNTGAGGTAHETGTLTFDKSAGTYTVDLTNPISGFSVLATAGAPASAFVNYNADGTTSQGPSNIATVQLANNFFIQFTGEHDTSGSPMSTTVAPGGTYTPVTTANFAGLELFDATATTVTVSSTAAGVAGNTIQGGEVLDFNLYTTDPHGTTGGTPTTNATSMFIELDGVGGAEDMIVVLKLYDTVTHQYTTQALMVQNGDIITSNATLAGTAYSGIVLDNNDGLIVIEANDYQGGNSNLVIVGAQIAGSDAGITGTATNFNGVLGSGGGSSGTQAFSTDVSDAPFKIQNIGFLTTTSTNQNADLTFNVTIKDGDGDSLTQTIHATVTANADSATPISLGAGVTTVSQTAIAPKVAPTQTATNSNSVLMGAFAAAGLAASDSLAAATPHTDLHSSVSHMATAAYHSASLVPAAIEGLDGHRGVNMLVRDAGEGQAHAAAQSTTFHNTDMVAAKGIAAAANTGHDPVASQLLHGTPAPAHAEPAASQVTAAAIAMPSASQLAAAHGGAVSGQHNSALGQVLAEALHGGGSTSTIDHVLSSLPNHGGGGNPALEALASHNAAGVPMGDSHAFAGFTAGHAAFSMETVMVHVDAVQPHA